MSRLTEIEERVDVREFMLCLQKRIDTLDKLIAEEAQRRWTIEAVLRADRSLLTEALMRLAAALHPDPGEEA